MIEFEVPEMTCGGCANRVARALSRLDDEDAQVEIDVPARRVRVARVKDERVDAYRAAIQAAGYSARRTTSSAPVQRAAGCCCASRRTGPADVHPVDGAQAGRCGG